MFTSAFFSWNPFWLFAPLPVPLLVPLFTTLLVHPLAPPTVHPLYGVVIGVVGTTVPGVEVGVVVVGGFVYVPPALSGSFIVAVNQLALFPNGCAGVLACASHEKKFFVLFTTFSHVLYNFSETS